MLKTILFPVDYFQWLLKFFQIFDLYSPKNPKFRRIYYIFSIPHITLTMLSIILDLFNIILRRETFQRTMLNIGVLSLHTAAGLRVLNWLWTRTKFEEIMRVIQRPSFEFAIFRYGVRNEKINERKRSSIDAFKTTRLRRTNLIYCSVYLLVFTYIFSDFLITYACNYLKNTHEAFNPTLNKTSVYRDYPYPIWFPFDVSISDGYYHTGYFYQLYAYYNLMTSFWCVDWLILSSIIQIQNQLSVISFALESVDKAIPDKISYEQIVLIKKIRLIKCVEELREISKAADLIEQLCNNQLLIQNSLATFILCSLLYVTTTLTIPVEISYISAVAGIVLLEPLTQCWICQDFTLEYSKVLEKVYELDWINYPRDLRRFLVLTMVRLQKPKVFTLGKWANIDMSFYLQLLKMTYSFYTLISRENKREK